MYDELKERCRACSQGCIYPSECSYFDKPPLRCMRQLLSEAADAIEELLDFAHFVASEVVVTDEEWDNNMLVFPEVASRKLNKLGIVKKDGAFWGYEPPKEET